MRQFTMFYANQQIVSLQGSADFDSEARLDEHAKTFGVDRSPPPSIRLHVTHPGQTPAQYAECFGYSLVPPQAWEQKHMRAAQALVDGGADPNRIALFVVPGGAG